MVIVSSKLEDISMSPSRQKRQKRGCSLECISLQDAAAVRAELGNVCSVVRHGRSCEGVQ
jgi:hypothetical protein